MSDSDDGSGSVGNPAHVLAELGEPPSRALVLHLLSSALRETHQKVESGRVRDAKNEKVRIQWITALCRVSSEYRQLLADRELDELAARLDDLEADDREDELDRFIRN